MSCTKCLRPLASTLSARNGPPTRSAFGSEYSAVGISPLVEDQDGGVS